VIASACRQLAEWTALGMADMTVAVNLSPAQLRNARVVEVVRRALKAGGLRPGQLELEITETTVLKHDPMLIDILGQLRELGVGIAFDDFGTGYASLSLVQHVPLTTLKIDRSFVEHMNENAGDAAIVRAVIAIGQALGLNIVAEGVETGAQERALRRLGCRTVQGFRYGRPMSGPDMVDWHRQRDVRRMRALP